MFSSQNKGKKKAAPKFCFNSKNKLNLLSDLMILQSYKNIAILSQSYTFMLLKKIWQGWTDQDLNLVQSYDQRT